VDGAIWRVDNESSTARSIGGPCAYVVKAASNYCGVTCARFTLSSSCPAIFPQDQDHRATLDRMSTRPTDEQIDETMHRAGIAARYLLRSRA
jgi:hypothetical protein